MVFRQEFIGASMLVDFFTVIWRTWQVWPRGIEFVQNARDYFPRDDISIRVKVERRH